MFKCADFAAGLCSGESAGGREGTGCRCCRLCRNPPVPALPCLAGDAGVGRARRSRFHRYQNTTIRHGFQCLPPSRRSISTPVTPHGISPPFGFVG